MIENIKYYKYPENFELVHSFFDVAKFIYQSKMDTVMDGYLQLIGNQVTEEMYCRFASECPEDTEEYFGDTGVVIYFYKPAADEDCAVILSNAQFYQMVSERLLKDFSISPENHGEKLQADLDKLKDMLHL